MAFQSMAAEYVYSEIQTELTTNNPVVVLHLNLQDHKPLSRKHITIDNARMLLKDLTSLMEQHDNDCDIREEYPDNTEDAGS